MNVSTAHQELMPTVPEDLPTGPRPMIATIRAIPGHEPQLTAAITTLTAAVRVEPGCVEFRAFHDATDPGVFYLYEIYTDTDAFLAHLTSTHVAQFFSGAAQHSTTDARGLIQLIELSPDDHGPEPAPEAGH